MLFLALEGISLMLITRNSIIQRYKIMNVVESVRTFFMSEGYNFSYYFSLKETNERLSLENRMLREQNGFLSEQLSFAQDSLKYFHETPQYTYTSALVVRNSTDKQHNVIIINKGSEDGIEEDMGVISPTGIVGYVFSTGKHYSRVISLLDVDQSISSVIKSNGTFGSLNWDGTDIGTATLHDIPVHTRITPGDTIVTSGYSAIFPAGIPIGTIKSSSIQDGINYDVLVSLLENFSSLNYVYVVKNRDKEELL